ncbi:MAG: hypothetical protein V1735_03660 [Nanoarchaeota archaeon]
MRRKRGNLSIETLGIILLVLIVVLVLGFIFRNLIVEFAGRIFKIAPDPNPNCLTDPTADCLTKDGGTSKAAPAG